MTSSWCRVLLETNHPHLISGREKEGKKESEKIGLLSTESWAAIKKKLVDVRQAVG